MPTVYCVCKILKTLEPFSGLCYINHILTVFSSHLAFFNRGPPQEEAPAQTSSNVPHPHPPRTHTQGRCSLSHRSLHHPSPWSSPCPPQQRCHSMPQEPQQHSSLPPSLNATRSNLCWARHLNATMLLQKQLPLLPALEVKFLTLTNSTKEAASKIIKGERNKKVAHPLWWSCLSNLNVVLHLLKRNGWTES